MCVLILSQKAGSNFVSFSFFLIQVKPFGFTYDLLNIEKFMEQNLVCHIDIGNFCSHIGPLKNWISRDSLNELKCTFVASPVHLGNSTVVFVF